MVSNIATIDLTMNSGGVQKTINPTLIWDEKEVVLIDVGVPGQLEVIQREMEKLGVPFSKLTKLILTHHDFDHIGSLPEVLNAAENKVEVIAHEIAKPYIQGEKRLIKLAPNVEAPKAIVDKTVTDGEVLSNCGGLKVIFTPGHTPDHISLYHLETKTLIAGDATISANGVVLGPNPQYTLEMEEAVESLGKFINYDIEKIICYHGGVCDGTEINKLKDLYNKQIQK